MKQWVTCPSFVGVLVLLEVMFSIAMTDGWAAAPLPPEGEESVEYADVESRDAVVVTGTRQQERLSESAIRADVIDAQTIEDSGAETMAELLEHQPGLEIYRTQRGRGSAVRIHGMDAKYVLVLVDGRRQVGDLDGAIDLERYLLDGVERVEIVKGASSALYGSRALGGVINIITRKPSVGVQADLHTSSQWGATEAKHWGQPTTTPAGMDLSGRVEVTRPSWSTATTAAWHSGQSIRYEPAQFSTTFPDFQEVMVSNESSVQLTAASTLSGGANYIRSDQVGRLESEPKATAFGVLIDQYDIKTITEKASVWVGYETLEPERYRWTHHLNALIYRDQYLANQIDAWEKDRYEETKENIVEARTQYDDESFAGHRLTFGLEAVGHELTSDRLEAGHLDRLTASAYAQDLWHVVGQAGQAGALDVVPAIRADLDSQYGIHTSPKIAFRYEPKEDLIIRSSLGSGFVAPRFKELGFSFENPNIGYRVVGNPDLEPENSWDADLSVEYRVTRWLSVSAALYRSELRDQIYELECVGRNDGTEPVACEAARESAGPIYAYENLERSRFMAAETGLTLRMGRLGKLSCSYTHTDGRLLEIDGAGNETWTLLSGRALHRLGSDLTLGWRPWGLRAALRGSWVGARPTDRLDQIGERVWAEDYISMDARVSKTLGAHLDVFVGVENIQNVYDSIDLVVMPRAVFMGLNGRM